MSEQNHTPVEVTEATTEVESASNKNEAGAAQEKVNKNVLFGTIGYDDDGAYENFLDKMNLNQAVFVLISSANFAQAKGSFNLLESEVLSTAIRVIRKSSSQEEKNQSEQ